MDVEFSAVRSSLDTIGEAIDSGAISGAEPWGGAGLVIRSSTLPESPNSFYPDPRMVVTPYCSELSWLLVELWSTFRPLLDHVTKIEFIGRLGNAAVRYQQAVGGREVVHDLLKEVLAEASCIADEIEGRTFTALPVAPGRAIADDFTDH